MSIFWQPDVVLAEANFLIQKNEKKDFIGKDVVFVYITDASSPELAWTTMIAEIPGELYKLMEIQCRSICEKY